MSIPRAETIVGLMSGTSADGVDAALVRFTDEPHLELLVLHHLDYEEPLRRRLLDVAGAAACDLDELCRLNFTLGEIFARAALAAIDRAGLVPEAVDLIGSHGHTIRHLPGRGRGTGSTMQIGEGSVIAERTGITTVCDFRPRDMAAGGQGAPLVPFFDYHFYAAPGRTRIILNIGGIANLTAVNADLGPEATIAFDTGPGNMVLDGLVRRFSQRTESFDRDGLIASTGRVRADLLAWALEHPYFRLPPPKSTGREEFGEDFLARFVRYGEKTGASYPDLVATAAALTASSIAGAARKHLGGLPPFDEIVAGGGGSRNPYILGRLRDELGPTVMISLVDEYGLPAEAKEAMAFAFLARETAKGRVNNLPAATGAYRGVIMGKIVPGRGGKSRQN